MSIFSTRKQTLYDALGVPADATQAQIAEACASVRARMQAGARIPDIATLSYAIETLRNPEARRRYDESLQRGAGLPARNTAFADPPRSLVPAEAMPSMRAAVEERQRAAEEASQRAVENRRSSEEERWRHDPYRRRRSSY